jgi:phospholipase/lecithinase/hemolysin
MGRTLGTRYRWVKGILRFDADQVLAQVVAQPADFGLTDVTHACITPTDAPFEC